MSSHTSRSRVLRRTDLAWDLDLVDPAKSRETRFPDFAAFFAFGFPALALPSSSLPYNEVLPLGLCALCLARPGTSRGRTPPWFLLGLCLVLADLAAASYLHGLTPAKRLLHVALYIVLAAFIASGRVHLPSAVRGLGFGLVAGIAGSMAGFGPDSYSGRLTGFLGDPNGGGYVMVVLGAVAIGLSTHRRLRLLLMALIPVAVVLTYSRTTLLALAFTLMWLLVGRRFQTVAGGLVVFVMIYVVDHIPAQLRLFGPFADRTGSDALRQRIIAQEHLDIAQSPLFGNGAGTSHVLVQGQVFFYHSSYLALRNEGGLVSLGLLIGVLGFTFFGLVRMPPELRNGWLEASLIGVLVCAVNLGEVFLELPTAVAAGVAIHYRLNAAREAESLTAQASPERSGPAPAPGPASAPPPRHLRRSSR